MTYDFKIYFCLCLFRNGFHRKKLYLIITNLWNLRPINWLQKSLRLSASFFPRLCKRWLICDIKSLVIPLPKVICILIIMYTNNLQYFVKYFLMTSVPHDPLGNLTKSNNTRVTYFKLQQYIVVWTILALLYLLPNLIVILGITFRIVLIPDIKPHCIKKCNLTALPQAFTLNCSEFRS